MGTLQIRNLPDDLHAQLSERAGRLGVSMSEYVTRLLRDDLSRPMFDDWAASITYDTPLRHIDTLSALDAVRDEYDPPR